MALDFEGLVAASPVDDNWRSLFASLAWIDVLRRDALVRPGVEERDAYEQVLRRVLDRTRGDGLELEYVYWSDHPSGVRASVLALAPSLLGLPDWLEAELVKTADHISRPENYKGWGNHCLMQNSGLLSIGLVLDEPAYVELAEQRGRALLETSVTPDGASTEGSIAYHTRLQRWWTEFWRKLRLAGFTLDASWERIPLMQVFADHATLPDGRMCGFGDTGLSDQQVSPADPAFPRRESRLGIFDVGYVFARGSSEPGQEDDTYLAARFGQAFNEAPHGHEDAGSIEWVVAGQRLFTDSGMFKYARSRWRNWVKQAAAHNIVTAPRRGYDQSAHSPIRHRSESGDHVVVVIDVATIPGVAWRRTVLFPMAGRHVIVLDEVVGPEEELFVQRWNVPRGVSYHVRGNEVAADDGRLYLRWLEGTPTLAVAEGWEGSEERPWVSGWRSEEYGQIAPAPAVEAVARTASWRAILVAESPRPADARIDVDVERLDAEGGAVVVISGQGSRTVRWEITS